MTKEKFLPKGPTKALVEVKEMLYDRVSVLRQCISADEEWVDIDAVDRQMENEIDFLTEVLNIIERS